MKSTELQRWVIDRDDWGKALGEGGANSTAPRSEDRVHCLELRDYL